MTATDSNNAPETYELPPEPPIGSRVRDRSGREWVRDASIGWKSEDESRVTIVGWALLMDYHGPLARIPDPEPDPWPTEPLIVADWAAGAAKGHGLLYLDGHEYVTIESGHVHEEGRDTLTNVVPVKPVPVAELDALREAMRAWDKEGFAPLIPSARNLLAATDALGVDL